MPDTESKKLLVKRPSRVSTDSRGRSVWADPVDSAELELVSTQMLKVMLASRDQSEIKAIEKAASGSNDGVLARNPGSGGFEIINDDELQEILAANENLPPVDKPADATLAPLKDYPENDRLSLVSTQALRRVLGNDEKDEKPQEYSVADADGGFNPYDNS
ncbi:MAG: hypothetical protein OEM63_03625 [Gammaproteobacteria bacterium]|nr:hypothetical protein [Gammaproteobacteria bacterium]